MLQLVRLSLAFCFLGCGLSQAASPQFEKIYELQPEEEVYAYARISASGRYLTYASQLPPDKAGPEARRPLTVTRDGVTRTQGFAIMEVLNVIDLQTQKRLLREAGVDGFWSNDERRLIYLSRSRPADRPSLWDRRSGEIVREVAPAELGAYYSWGVRDGRHLILTILGDYFYLSDKHHPGEPPALLPPSHIADCPQMGPAERPLLSRDGKRITAFVGGTLVVRNLTDCENVFNTGIAGAKADFSWEGRYIAFHAPKPKAQNGYEIRIVDMRRRTVRTLEGLTGSALFPSWTRDGRLCFRYEGEDYNGFMIASHILAGIAEPLPPPAAIAPKDLTWSQIFPETPLPSSTATVVLIWASWSPYSAHALVEMQKIRDYFRDLKDHIAFAIATDLTSPEADIERIIAQNKIDLPRIALAPNRFVLTDAVNQIPATLLFHKDRLVDRRLGAQSLEQLKDWLLTP